MLLKWRLRISQWRLGCISKLEYTQYTCRLRFSFSSFFMMKSSLYSEIDINYNTAESPFEKSSPRSIYEATYCFFYCNMNTASQGGDGDHRRTRKKLPRVRTVPCLPEKHPPTPGIHSEIYLRAASGPHPHSSLINPSSSSDVLLLLLLY